MTAKAVADIETIDTRVVYENRWMKVREDGIRRKDGSLGVYGVVEKPDFVAIVPVEDDGSLHLVEQYRYPVGKRYWEIPQGTWEEVSDADLLEMARGELREETGLDATQMTYIGHLFQGYGYATQGYHVFLAQGLCHGDAEREHEEQDLVSRNFSFADVVEMIQTGDIKDATTIAALGLLQLAGKL